MAAPRWCALCNEAIGKKTYRVIEKNTIFVKYMSEISAPTSGYLCNSCVTRFNRLEKVDFDINTKVERLKQARAELVLSLVKTTPRKARKRLIRHTPTPKAVKKLSTEKDETSQARGAVPIASKKKLSFDSASGVITGVVQVKTTEERGVQTHIDIHPKEEFDVKLIVVQSGKIKSKIVRDNFTKVLLTNVIYNRGAKALVNCIKGEKAYARAILDLETVCRVLRQELCNLSRYDKTFLRGSSLHFDTFSWVDIWEELKLEAPSLHAVFRTVHLFNESLGDITNSPAEEKKSHCNHTKQQFLN